MLYLRFLRDLCLSMCNLIFGKILPTLKVPDRDASGKLAIITGANTGIGFYIALDLVKRNATVYLACRSEARAQEAISNILSKVPTARGRLHSLVLDTSSLTSVRAFATTWHKLDKHVDLLIHNAGTAQAPAGEDFTSEGFEAVYTTNFLSSFLVTYLLETALSADARVIFTSSAGSYAARFSKGFSISAVKERIEPGFHAAALSENAITLGRVPKDSSRYGNSKAMQIAFAKTLQAKWDRRAKEGGTKVTRVAHAFSPGFVYTPVFEKMGKCSMLQVLPFWFLNVSLNVLAGNAAAGAKTAVWLAITRDEAVIGKGNGGSYWERMTRRTSSVDLLSDEVLRRMWIRWEADAGIQWRD